MSEILKKNVELSFAKEENFLDWNIVLKRIQENFGKDVYESWIKSIALKKNLIIMLFCPLLQDLLEIG